MFLFSPALYLAIPSIAFGSWRPFCTDKFLTDVLMDDSTAYCQISGKHLIEYYQIVKNLAVKKCDETPLLKKLEEKTLAIEIIFAKVFTQQYVRITTRCQLIS